MNEIAQFGDAGRVTCEVVTRHFRNGKRHFCRTQNCRFNYLSICRSVEKSPPGGTWRSRDDPTNHKPRIKWRRLWGREEREMNFIRKKKVVRCLFWSRAEPVTWSERGVVGPGFKFRKFRLVTRQQTKWPPVLHTWTWSTWTQFEPNFNSIFKKILKISNF